MTGPRLASVQVDTMLPRSITAAINAEIELLPSSGKVGIIRLPGTRNVSSERPPALAAVVTRTCLTGTRTCR